MRWIGAGTVASGKYWIKKYSKENPEQLKAYIDGLRQYYRDTKATELKAEIALVGKLAQAAHLKAFGKEH